MLRIINPSDTPLIGIYLEHERRVGECEPRYELNETLFSINEPFYMNSEKEALIRDIEESERKTNKQSKRYKRLINKNNIYDRLLSEPQKRVINEVINDMKHRLRHSVINIGDNKSGEQMARMALTFNNFQHYSNKLSANQRACCLTIDDLIIPPNCSFMCSDVSDGLRVMINHYQQKRFRVSDHFMVVIDPPWLSNKSVKRKRCYQTDNNTAILQMTQSLNSLINLFPKQTELKVCIWSTHKEKEFVLNQMIPTLNCKCTHVLLWHKITTNGQNCKIRGGLEYLIIASNSASLESGCEPLEGVLVSIPSAIHSHKPPVVQLIRHLFAGPPTEPSLGVHRADGLDPSVPTELDSNRIHGLSESINSLINGLELYARYLTVGFHSIGNECLKLQNRDLFVVRHEWQKSWHLCLWYHCIKESVILWLDSVKCFLFRHFLIVEISFER